MRKMDTIDPVKSPKCTLSRILPPFLRRDDFSFLLTTTLGAQARLQIKAFGCRQPTVPSRSMTRASWERKGMPCSGSGGAIGFVSDWRSVKEEESGERELEGEMSDSRAHSGQVDLRRHTTLHQIQLIPTNPSSRRLSLVSSPWSQKLKARRRGCAYASFDLYVSQESLRKMI
ncbi:hypothetical protein SCHPADRAFT_907862, partial [Schizopora paradoxa]